MSILRLVEVRIVCPNRMVGTCCVCGRLEGLGSLYPLGEEEICEGCAAERGLVPCLLCDYLIEIPRDPSKAELCHVCAARVEKAWGCVPTAAECAGVDWEEQGLREPTWRRGE